MTYFWIATALGGLDQMVKQNIEEQEAGELPRDLPCAKGWIRLHKSHNSGFPFGVLKDKPQLVRNIPLMMTSALAGALVWFFSSRGLPGEEVSVPDSAAHAWVEIYLDGYGWYPVEVTPGGGESAAAG